MVWRRSGVQVPSTGTKLTIQVQRLSSRVMSFCPTSIIETIVHETAPQHVYRGSPNECHIAR
jgi:hypothetical protein